MYYRVVIRKSIQSKGPWSRIVKWYLQFHQQWGLVYVENLWSCKQFHPIYRSRKTWM